MRMVSCCECKKRYDYEEDGFCPKCGAFNQPPREARIGPDGSVIRVDGLNEAGHEGSFAHREFHEEEQERRRSGLDKSVRRVPRPDAGEAQTAGSHPYRRAGTAKKSGGNPLKAIIWMIAALFLLNLLSRVLFILF